MDMDQKVIDPEELSAQDKMAKSSFWLTVGDTGSRILGAVYVIPWVRMMGENGNLANALYGMGYNLYALFLMLSTAGIPSAISKQIAHYNSRGEYATSRKLFHRALVLMAGLGFVAGAFMWVTSPWLAQVSGGEANLIPVIRSLAVSVVVLPPMSVLRGYFLGQSKMAPVAKSQVFEQIARVFYMLAATFVIMSVLKGDYGTAVMHSTLAAFVGAIASYITLLLSYRKDKIGFDVKVENSVGKVKLNTKDLILETIQEAIPFIILGTAITLFKLVDQVTFVNWMKGFTEYSGDQLRILYALFNFNPDKLTMVVVGFATSMSLAGIPLITEAKTRGNHKGLAELISNNLQLFAFVMIPATFGMVALAFPLNTMFYGASHLGTGVLIEATFCALILGLFMMTSQMLQGMYENTSAIAFFLCGLIVKLIFQYPCIRLFEVYGPLVATMLGFGVTCGLNLYKLYKVSRFNRLITARRTVLITLMSLVMLVFVLLTKFLLGFVLSPERAVSSFIMILIVAAVGVAVYGYMALKIRLADKLLGSTAERIRRVLHLKK